MGTYRNYEKETTETVDGISITEKEQISDYIKNEEPDYIKLYTNMWCEFNQIPIKWRTLFLSLVMRMTYCNKDDLENSQVVATGGPVTTAIQRECGWTTADPVYKGLKVLTDCKAIKRIARGWYQINPSYAGKGSWNYNPKYKQGGIKDLIAIFNFRQGTVETTTTWTDNDTVMSRKQILKTPEETPEEEPVRKDKNGVKSRQQKLPLTAKSKN